MQAGQNAELRRDVVRPLPYVHWITARPNALIPFDNGYLVSSAAEQRGKGCTGDSSARNQYAQTAGLHSCPLRLLPIRPSTRPRRSASRLAT